MQRDTIQQIAIKELTLFFSSPIGYLFLAVYLGVTLFVFFWVEAFFARNIADVRSIFEWLPILLIFLASALTMRSWSDERRLGTIEFLTTLPATSWELVLGKFIGCLVLLLIALVLTFPLPITVALIGNLDWGPVIAGYLASVLLGSTYLSIGLFVSARSDNQIVALIVTSFLCGVFYFLGSPFLTGLVDNATAEVLRNLGSGSRFTSITRGVIDFRDLFFYGSVTIGFLALNTFSLASLGWTTRNNVAKHRLLRLVSGLFVANVLVANVWLYFIDDLRWDVTEGKQYSISEVTSNQLNQLTEPLLMRGYFSAKTHPLLAPLVPQLTDLLAEYEMLGGERLKLELIDPMSDPEAEDEANSKYGIRPVTFQVPDRRQPSLVNSYFDILIQYGDEYEVLGFRDLIEVKAKNEAEIDVKLNNPEYQITRSIRKVMSGFQSGGTTFEFIQEPLTFTGYFSSAENLPETLAETQPVLVEVLAEMEEEASGKFQWSFVDPEAGDGAVAEEIAATYGFRPMAASLFDTNTFYFYMILSDGNTIISLPLPDTLDKESFKTVFEEGLKRYTVGLLSRVEVVTPAPSQPANPYMQQMAANSQFNNLDSYLSGDFDVENADLVQGVSTDTDVLLVLEPQTIDEAQLFMIDQYLMRGGTVVIATGAYTANVMQQSLLAQRSSSGMVDWLSHHGISVADTMVLDTQNSAFPVPTTRQVGNLSFQEIRMLDYPFFVEVQGDALNSQSPITNNLNQMTVAWVSPLAIDQEKNKDRSVIELIRSSESSWTEVSPDIMPKITADGSPPFSPGEDQQSHVLAVAVEGRFESYFSESPLLEAAREELATAEAETTQDETDGEEVNVVSGTDEIQAESDALPSSEDTLGVVSSVIDRSPESAKLIVLGSSETLSDQTISMISSASGSLYVNGMQFISNIVDWSVEDASLLSIRGRGHFNRTLPPLADETQNAWEYGNYVLAIVGLLVVFGLTVQMQKKRRARFGTWLGDLT